MNDAVAGAAAKVEIEVVARMLWEKQSEGTAWEGKIHLMCPDSLADYRDLAEKIIATIHAIDPATVKVEVKS